MSGSRCFVQFSHPGTEHEPDPGGGKAWNTHASSHARKFMEFPGRWMEEDGSTREGRLRAWGEWEAESHLLRELRRPGGDWLHPRFLWEPYYVPREDHHRLHNTDPFIFGPRFLYSNCGQLAKPGLRALGPGSVIAFGSGKGIAGDRRWMVDTVMVIAGSVEYGAGDAREALSGLADEGLHRGDGRADRRQRGGVVPALPGGDARRSGRRYVQLLPRNASGGRVGIPEARARPPGGILQPEKLAGPEGPVARALLERAARAMGFPGRARPAGRARARYPRDFAAEARGADASGVRAARARRVVPRCAGVRATCACGRTRRDRQFAGRENTREPCSGRGAVGR